MTDLERIQKAEREYLAALAAEKELDRELKGHLTWNRPTLARDCRKRLEKQRSEVAMAATRIANLKEKHLVVLD